MKARSISDADLAGNWHERLTSARALLLTPLELAGDGSGSLATLSRRAVVLSALPCPVTFYTDGIIGAVRLEPGGGRFSFRSQEPDKAAAPVLQEIRDENVVSIVEPGGATIWLATDAEGDPGDRMWNVYQTIHAALDLPVQDELTRRRQLADDAFTAIGWHELRLPTPEGPADVRISGVSRASDDDPAGVFGRHLTPRDLVRDMERMGRALVVVPEPVEAQIERARLLYVRGWHQWEFFTDAKQHALLALEGSLRALYVRTLGAEPVDVAGTDKRGNPVVQQLMPDWPTLYDLGSRLKWLQVAGEPFPRFKPQLVAFVVRKRLLSRWEAERAAGLFWKRDRYVHPDGPPPIDWISWARGDFGEAVELINRMWARLEASLPMEIAWAERPRRGRQSRPPAHLDSHRGA